MTIFLSKEVVTLPQRNKSLCCTDTYYKNFTSLLYVLTGGDAARHCPCSQNPPQLHSEYPSHPQEG